MPSDSTCHVTYCTRERAAHRPYCWTHTKRHYRHGNPHFTRRPTPDPVAVDRAVHEHRADELNLPERRIVASKLTSRGESAARIAALLHVTQRTVERWRAADRRTITSAA